MSVHTPRFEVVDLDWLLELRDLAGADSVLDRSFASFPLLDSPELFRDLAHLNHQGAVVVKRPLRT
ncbi:uncharacterized protein METZ01_LOCUS464488 [marine metagenome]|uniref:Uncharacterized protein n=1 Tax=marine metagenome TaxID=408172 RepID=A0A383AVE4_9ZZZZ